uniref:Uncharacterized protein n=1 Tax=viral metagenome TaxID=1070528 RepID=A0A6M3L6C2_9ZZZZ
MEPTIAFESGGLVAPDRMKDAAADFGQTGFLRILARLGATSISPKALTGTIDGYEQPNRVFVQDMIWPVGPSLSSTALHGAVHLFQQRYPWGGSGLEVMAHTAELLFLFHLGYKVGDYEVRIQMDRLRFYLDRILDAEMKLLGG